MKKLNNSPETFLEKLIFLSGEIFLGSWGMAELEAVKRQAGWHRNKPTWFQFYERPTVVRFNETESRIAITRGWGLGKTGASL